MRLADLEFITRRLDSQLAASGVRIASYYYCVHKVEDNCECRKPKPGLLRKAAEDFRAQPGALRVRRRCGDRH